MAQTTKSNKNVNQILDSVDDKLIAKKKLKRTIISSVLLSVIVVLSAVVISLANINVNLMPKFLSNPDSYDINLSGYNYSTRIDEDSATYEKFLDEYNSSFKTSILTAIFTGKLAGYSIEETNTQFYKDSDAKTGMSNSLSSSVGNNYIKLTFDEIQSVKNKNGSQYYSTRYPKDTYALKFKDCYLKLSSEASGNMTLYLGTYDPDSGYVKDAMITKVTIKVSAHDVYESLADYFELKSST